MKHEGIDASDLPPAWKSQLSLNWDSKRFFRTKSLTFQTLTHGRYLARFLINVSLYSCLILSLWAHVLPRLHSWGEARDHCDLPEEETADRRAHSYYRGDFRWLLELNLCKDVQWWTLCRTLCECQEVERSDFCSFRLKWRWKDDHNYDAHRSD